MNATDQTDASARQTPAPWVAWRRKRGGRWWIASEGQTESEALSKLLDRAKAEGPGSYDVLVLKHGDQP